tara:strand:- start:851 stop:1564 length:714 start_codon:yes stop_codon:yes gene_type:complete
MCIAINSTSGTTPKRRELEISFENNPDGIGYCFAKDGKLVIRKAFFKFEEFYQSYLSDNIQGQNKLIHFRIATSGLIDELNCHPFKITDEIAFIHNGIIPHYGDKEENDTLQFCKEMLRPIFNEFGVDVLKRKSFRKTLIQLIGNSKLAFLDNNGNSYIINEKMGHSKNGIWFSNGTYKEYGNLVGYYPNNYHYDYEHCIECDSKLDVGEYEVCNECEDLTEYDGWGNKNTKLIYKS